MKEEKNIDIFINDLLGPNEAEKLSENTKIGMALLSFIYRKQLIKSGKDALTDELDENLITGQDEWMAEMGYPFVDTKAVLANLRKTNILNSANLLRKAKDADSGILWALFSLVLEGNLECSFTEGDYRFKTTEKGKRHAIDLLKKY